MRRILKALTLLSSIAAVYGVDKDAAFKVNPAGSYAHQTISSVTIGGEVYSTQQELKSAFGKLNPLKYGVLPVLVVMQNASNQTLQIQNMEVRYIRPDGRSLVSVPPADVPYLHGVDKPRTTPSPIPPIPGIGGKKKNPLDAWEIGGRAFSAKMLPPGESAHGFFYFQSADHRTSKLYVTGITEAGTGKELFYFEIPLE
jgi:hypothetical protein